MVCISFGHWRIHYLEFKDAEVEAKDIKLSHFIEFIFHKYNPRGYCIGTLQIN